MEPSGSPELLLEPQTSQLGAGGRVSEQHFPSSHRLYPDTGGIRLLRLLFLCPGGCEQDLPQELHLPGLWTLT